MGLGAQIPAGTSFQVPTSSRYDSNLYLTFLYVLIGVNDNTMIIIILL